MATAMCAQGQRAPPLSASEPGQDAVACAHAAGVHVDGASAVISANMTSRVLTSTNLPPLSFSCC